MIAMTAQEDATKRLARWYASVCDGHWETRVRNRDPVAGKFRLGSACGPQGYAPQREALALRSNATPPRRTGIAWPSKKGRPHGYGDPSKLNLLLGKFGAFIKAHER